PSGQRGIIYGRSSWNRTGAMARAATTVSPHVTSWPVSRAPGQRRPRTATVKVVFTSVERGRPRPQHRPTYTAGRYTKNRVNITTFLRPRTGALRQIQRKQATDSTTSATSL